MILFSFMVVFFVVAMIFFGATFMSSEDGSPKYKLGFVFYILTMVIFVLFLSYVDKNSKKQIAFNNAFDKVSKPNEDDFEYFDDSSDEYVVITKTNYITNYVKKTNKVKKYITNYITNEIIIYTDNATNKTFNKNNDNSQLAEYYRQQWVRQMFFGW